jgi:hypothetical protein
MCDIPFDRSILQLLDGIKHVMPSTDRMLELTAKLRWLSRLTAGRVFQWVKLFIITGLWILLRVLLCMSCGMAEVVMKCLPEAHIVLLFRCVKRRSLWWTAFYNTPNTRSMNIGGKKWQGKIEVPRENPIFSVTLFLRKLHMDFFESQL